MKLLIAISLIGILLPTLVRAQDCSTILEQKRGLRGFKIGMPLDTKDKGWKELAASDDWQKEGIVKVFTRPDQSDTVLGFKFDDIEYYFFEDTLYKIEAGKSDSIFELDMLIEKRFVDRMADVFDTTAGVIGNNYGLNGYGFKCCSSNALELFVDASHSDYGHELTFFTFSNPSIEGRIIEAYKKKLRSKF